MFCPKCGGELPQESQFCTHCGNIINAQTQNVQGFANGAGQQYNQPFPYNATVYFCPKRVWGQFILRKATIEIASQKMPTKINSFSKLEIAPGETDVLCYANYLGKCGKAKLRFMFESGKTYVVNYRSPLIVFMAGKLNIQPANPSIEAELNSRKKGKMLKWGVIAAVILIICVMIFSGGGSDTGTASTDNQQTVSNDNGSNTNGELSGAGSGENEINNSDSGQFDETPYDLYSLMSSSMTSDEDLYFDLNDKATAFLQNNPSLFPAKTEDECISFTDDSISFEHIAKNDDKYGDKLMYIPILYVAQITETDIGDGTYISELNVGDEYGNQYYIIYIGELPDIFENDTIYAYGLPLSMSQFSNVEGGITLCPIIAGSYIGTIE